MDTELVTPRITRRAAPKRLSLTGDEHLARLIGRGNEDAFAVLYERYYQRLYRYCRSMLHNEADAQDALQSAFAGAFSALSQGRRDAPMRPWLYRIAYNESVSVLRRRRPEVALSEAHETPAASTEELVAERARLALLVADLGQLTERQRGALVMRELSGLSHEEIATAFGISVGAAKQTIFEARRSLAEFAAGRAMSCDDICRAVSDGNGRVLRGRKVRAHLRECGSCAAFAAAIPARSYDLRAIAPPLSAVAAAGLLRQVVAGSGHGAGGGTAVGTAAGGGAATASGGAGSGVATLGGAGTGVAGSGSATVAAGAMTKAAGLGLLGKAAVGTAVVASAAGGLAGVVTHVDSSSRGTASNRALRQTHAHASRGSVATHPVVVTGAARARAAATATPGALHRGTPGHRTAPHHRGSGHHGALAAAQSSTGKGQTSDRGAASSQGAAHGVSRTKSQATVHASLTRSVQPKAHSSSSSSTHASAVHSTATNRPTHRRSQRSATHGRSGPSHPAPGASAPGSQPAAGAHSAASK